MVSRVLRGSFFLSRSLGVLVILFALCYGQRSTFAQGLLPLSGTRFTFSIIEGPDIIGGDSVISQLQLSVVSDKGGDGIILSPNGYQQRFTFDAQSVTSILVDYNMMLLRDLGKSEKGLIVFTSQPVTLTIHDFAPEAGDATQLLPDNALDTSYVIAAWSIYNDTLYSTQTIENNHSEFVVTAPYDSTLVTITPTTNTLDGHLAGVPFVVRLDRGECYIVKTDLKGRLTNASLVRSTVSATKPVSVIVGLTCAYNPLGVESCNELMDELIPRSAWGTEFNAIPLTPDGTEDILYFSSDVPNYTLQVQGGLTYFSTTGHVQIPIVGPLHITSTVPVQCHELSEGSELVVFGESDPSMVTVLPVTQYHDTLIWQTPIYPFDINYLSAVVPTASIPQMNIDGIPISSVGQFATITPSMSGLWIPMEPGRHELTSPVPVFGIVDGFAQADAYTFVTGTVTDSIRHFLTSRGVLVAEGNSIYCRAFSVDLNGDSTIIDGQNALETIVFNITYNPKQTQLRGIIVNAILQGDDVTIDTSVVGAIHLKIASRGPLYNTIGVKGPFFRLDFLSIDSTVKPIVLVNSYSYNSIFPDLPASTGLDTLIAQPYYIVDTVALAMSVDAGSTPLGSIDTATVRVGSVSDSEGVQQFVLTIKYDHDILSFRQVNLSGMVASGWTVSAIDTIDNQTERLTFTSTTDSLSGSGVLVRLLFDSYVSDSSTALLQVSGVFAANQFCPLVLASPNVNGLFLGKELCGDAELEKMLNKSGLILDGISPNPSSGTFKLEVNSGLKTNLTISVLDLLGREVWVSRDNEVVRGVQQLTCAVPSLPAGSYVVRLSTPLGATSTRIVVQK